MRPLLVLVAASAALVAAPVDAQAIKRDVAAPTALFARSVEVPPGFSTLYLSGVPSNAPGGTPAQTAEVLKKLGEALNAAGYGYADVVNVKVYLVADPATGQMDFAGMNREFQKVFGTAANPAKPSRVTVQVAGLAMPGALVEIEMTAARK